MKALFTAIADHLQNQLPAIKWIDDDYGQIDSYQLRPSVVFPCVLISINYPDTQDTGHAADQEQIIRAQITLRLATERIAPSNNQAPPEVRSQALAHYDLQHQVYQALQGFDNGNTFTPLTRRQATTENRRDGLKVVRQIFETSFVEY